MPSAVKKKPFYVKIERILATDRCCKFDEQNFVAMESNLAFQSWHSSNSSFERKTFFKNTTSNIKKFFETFLSFGTKLLLLKTGETEILRMLWGLKKNF